MKQGAEPDLPPSYNQPTKVAARNLALTHAVELLTVRREEAAIVRSDHVERVKAQLLKSKTPGYRTAGERCNSADIASWQAFRATSIGKRKPEELTVAYLAGPEPSNDLETLVGLGLRPENIWAFEVNLQLVAAGLSNLEQRGLRGVKFIPISIDEYFVGTPRRFDIIYIDACGPLPSNEQKTTRLLVDIFKHGALAPLGVLITNFSKPDVSKTQTLDTYSSLIAAYLFPKAFVENGRGQMIEGPPVYGYEFENSRKPRKSFLTTVKKDFEAYYGAFITRHILDIASIIAPTVRLTNSKLYQVLFDHDIQRAADRARRFVIFNENAFEFSDEEIESLVSSEPSSGIIPDMDGDAIMDAGHYSLLWTLAACGVYETDQNINAPSKEIKKFAARWKNQLTGAQPTKKPAEDLIAAFYAWCNDSSFWSPGMKEIKDFPYMDVMPFLCDVPTQEIGFYPAFAQLAYPSQGNIRETKRYRYIAERKTTPMFMDVMAFDECRYVYDWLSALHLLPGDWFDLSAQLTFRFALDGIVKERRWFGDDFLFGCHVVGVDEEFPASELEPRLDISRNE